MVKAHLSALKYLKKEKTTNVFNLGTNKGYSVRDLINTCEKVTGKKVLAENKIKRAGDPAILIADYKKANKILGWKPEKTLEYSIKTVYEWEKKLQAENC